LIIMVTIDKRWNFLRTSESYTIYSIPQSLGGPSSPPESHTITLLRHWIKYVVMTVCCIIIAIQQSIAAEPWK
jgi:hypothetical protein